MIYQVKYIYPKSDAACKGRGAKCQKAWVRTNKKSNRVSALILQRSHMESRKKEGNPGAESQGPRFSHQQLEPACLYPGIWQLWKAGRPPAWTSEPCPCFSCLGSAAELRNTSKYGRVYMGKPVCLKYYSSLQGSELFLENSICWWELF